MSKKKNVITLQMEVSFNDIAMMEMGLDVNDHDHIYDENDEIIIKYDGCYLKYYEEEYVDLRPDEIKLNLIKNSRIMDALTARYLDKYCNANNMKLSTYYQVGGVRGTKGYAVASYVSDGVSKDIKSDEFINESVRLLSLICKVNGRSEWYDLEKYDIVEVK